MDLQRIVRHREVPGDTSAERFMLAMLAFEAIRRDQPAAVVRELALRALARGRMVAEDSTRATAYYAATIALIEAEAYEDARVAVADGMANSLRLALPTATQASAGWRGSWPRGRVGWPRRRPTSERASNTRFRP